MMPPILSTYSGIELNLLAPTPGMIDIGDIAIGLAHECRFAGQINCFYSVAQHSLLVADIIISKAPEYFTEVPQLALEALLHDATEAYLKDLPSPLKALLPEYRAIEHDLDLAIRKRFGLPQERNRAAIVEADRIALATERAILKPNSPEWDICRGIAPFKDSLDTMLPSHAWAAFMQAFWNFGGRN
jgi:5'-deoxynucleotidase YfbR-like HD superfamily hydrolase